MQEGQEFVGYLLKESPTPAPASSDPGWSAPSSGNYPFATPGSKTLYAWAKDGAGNVSDSLSAAIIINTPSQEPLPDMTLWVGKWFKITEKNTGYSFGNSGFRTDSGSYVGYLKLWNWDPNNKVLQGDRYEQDANSGQWFSEPLTLHYIAGSNLDFLCSFQVTDNTANTSSGLTGRVRGRKVSGALGTATLKTLGGYYIEISNGSNSTEYYVGGLKITGNLISDSKVPVTAEVILH